MTEARRGEPDFDWREGLPDPSEVLPPGFIEFIREVDSNKEGANRIRLVTHIADSTLLNFSSSWDLDKMFARMLVLAVSKGSWSGVRATSISGSFTREEYEERLQEVERRAVSSGLASYTAEVIDEDTEPVNLIVPTLESVNAMIDRVNGDMSRTVVLLNSSQ